MEKLKENTTKLKNEIVEVLVTNIKDQNKSDYVAGLFSCFDLSTDESKEKREEKLEKLHDMYGHTTFHTLKDKW